MADDGFDEDADIFGANDAPPACDLCGVILDMTPVMAAKHPAVRLDCPEHGARLMWTPFGDDAR